jgi:hypothetical protein
VGRPEHIAPGVVPLELVLANSGRAAVVLTAALAYLTGFSMQLVAVIRDPEGAGPIRPLFAPRVADPEAMLRFGVQFADGSKATNLPGLDLGRIASRQPPSGPLLLARGGSGGGGIWDQHWWVWPLPPAGTLVFACEWPAYDIELHTQTIDAERLCEAAQRARQLWEQPNLPDPPAGASIPATPNAAVLPTVVSTARGKGDTPGGSTMPDRADRDSR